MDIAYISIIIIVVLLLLYGGYRMFFGTTTKGTSKINANCRRATKDKIGVFCIGKNIFRYVEARDAVEKFGARLATMDELDAACKSGCNWNTLGWCQDFNAFICRNGKLEGGIMPGQLRLGVYGYGFKPVGQEAEDLMIL